MPSTTVHTVIRVRAPVSRVFSFLSVHENFVKAYGSTCSVIKEGEGFRDGPGSVRSCLPWPLTFEETIVESEKDSKIVYTISKGGPVKNHLGTLAFSPTPDGGTEIDYTISFDPRIPGTGWAIKRMLERAWIDNAPKAMKELETQ